MTPATEARLRELRRMERRNAIEVLAILAVGAAVLWGIGDALSPPGRVAGALVAAALAGLHAKVGALKRELRRREGREPKALG